MIDDMEEHAGQIERSRARTADAFEWVKAELRSGRAPANIRAIVDDACVAVIRENQVAGPDLRCAQAKVEILTEVFGELAAFFQPFRNLMPELDEILARADGVLRGG